jgi:Tfp pilus assembly protein PilO
MRPNLAQADSLRAEAQVLNQERQTQMQQLELLRAQLESGGEKEDISRLILRALPLDIRNDAQLSSLNQLAAFTGVSVTAFDPSEPVASGLFRRKAVSLNIDCTYESCLRFMGGLQGMTRVDDDKILTAGPLWMIDQVALTPGEGNSMSLALVATLFMAPLDEPEPPPAAPPSSAPPGGAE